MSAYIQGIGLGLRNSFLDEVTGRQDGPDFFEFFPHQFHGYGGSLRRSFEAVVERFPMITHNTSLSVGGFDPLHPDVLCSIRDAIAETGGTWWSDHLCWSGARGAHASELLPLPFSEEAVEHVVRRARQAEDAVGARLALENVSALIRAPGGTMTEAQFTTEVLERGDLLMLLDVNNVVVNSKNFGGRPEDFIDGIPLERVAHIHLSGHTVTRHAVYDTHTCPIPDEVWDLYQYTLRRAGRMIPSVIEWDTAIPTYDEVLAEVDKARTMASDALVREAA